MKAQRLTELARRLDALLVHAEQVVDSDSLKINARVHLGDDVVAIEQEDAVGAECQATNVVTVTESADLDVGSTRWYFEQFIVA